ncbi:hypothetical protein ACOSQ3_013303 [Xanthoceras sorbifolium]
MLEPSILSLIYTLFVTRLSTNKYWLIMCPQWIKLLIFTKALSTPRFLFLRNKLTIATSPMSLRVDVNNIATSTPTQTISQTPRVQASLAFLQTPGRCSAKLSEQLKPCQADHG